MQHADHDRGDPDHLDAHRIDDVFHVLQHDHHANRGRACNAGGHDDHCDLDNDHAYAFYNVDHDAYHVDNAYKHDDHNGVYGAYNACKHGDHNGVYAFGNACDRDDAYGDAHDNGAFLACGDSSDDALRNEADDTDARNRDSQRQYSTDNHKIRYCQKSHHWLARST